MQLDLMREQVQQGQLQGDQVIPGQRIPLSQNYSPESEFKVASDQTDEMQKEASSTNERNAFDEYLDSILGVDEVSEENEKTAEDNTTEEPENKKRSLYSEEEKENIISDVLEKKAHFTNMKASDILRESKIMREKDDEELEKEAEYWNEKVLNDELNVAEPHNKRASYNDNNGPKTSDELFEELIEKMKKYKSG